MTSKIVDVRLPCDALHIMLLHVQSRLLFPFVLDPSVKQKDEENYHVLRCCSSTTAVTSDRRVASN